MSCMYEMPHGFNERMGMMRSEAAPRLAAMTHPASSLVIKTKTPKLCATQHSASTSCNSSACKVMVLAQHYS